MNLRADNPNLAPLLKAAQLLAPMLDQIAFVGGCATGLLVSDPAAAPVRTTLDVDAIIEIASYAEFLRSNRDLPSWAFAATRLPLFADGSLMT